MVVRACVRTPDTKAVRNRRQMDVRIRSHPLASAHSRTHAPRPPCHFTLSMVVHATLRAPWDADRIAALPSRASPFPCVLATPPRRDAPQHNPRRGRDAATAGLPAARRSVRRTSPSVRSNPRPFALLYGVLCRVPCCSSMWHGRCGMVVVCLTARRARRRAADPHRLAGSAKPHAIR